MDEKFKFKFSLANLLWMMVPIAWGIVVAKLVGWPWAIIPAIWGLCSGIGALFGGTRGLVKGFLYGIPLALFVFIFFIGVVILLAALNVINIDR